MSVLQETGATSRGARRARYARYVPSAGFLRFVLRRFAAMILMLLGVTVVAWALTNVVPGDPAATSLGPVGSLDPKLVEFYQHKYGLDKSLPEQYWLYLKNLLHGDLGTSFSTTGPSRTTCASSCRRPPSSRCSPASSASRRRRAWDVGGLATGGLPDQVLRVVSLAGLSAPHVLARACRPLLLLLPAGVRAGRRPARPRPAAPPHTTGAYTIDSLIHGQWWTLGTRSGT